MALSKYVVDRISYTMPRTFRGKPSRIANVVDLTYDTASFFQTLGGVFTSTAESLVHWALNDGLFLREPKNRRQAHVYVTGLHGGVELLSRDRHAEELQYLLHDLTHELIPDLLLDEGFNTPLGRKVYVARRAASEIVAIAAEDIWSSAGKDAGTLKHAAQRVLQEYGKGLRPILVADTHWNDRNFRAAEASAANFVNWTKKNRPLLAAYGLRRETIGEITKRLSLQKHLTWTQLLDRIFEDAFESQVAPVLSARPAKLLPVEQRRARSVVRYMAGQMAVFERFRELPETTRTEREISALLWNRTKGMEQSDAENLRSRLEEYLTFLLNSHQIDFDDYQTFRGVYPWFPPFYLRFDAYDGLTPEDILDGGGPLLAEEGTDYRIDTKDRKASVTVLAIHGGTIEPYTTELAAEIAGTNHNFYSFTGLLKERAHAQLHIGSNQFREPRAVRFMEQSAVGISVHGFYDEARLAVCIGGAHTGLGKRVATELSRALPHVAIEHPCEEFPGTSPNNIVNRAAAGGVQLELSSRLRRELRNNHPMKEAFVKAVRSAVSASPAYKE